MGMTAALALLSLTLAAPSWKAELLSDDAAVRAPALARLRAKGRPGLYALQDLVARAAEPNERAKAVRALGALGNPDAEWALRGELKQPPVVAAAAVRAVVALRLTRLRNLVVARVGEADPDLAAALGESAALFPAVTDAARALLSDARPVAQLAGLRILSAAGEIPSEADARRLAASPLPEAALLAAELLAPSDPQAAEAVYAQLAVGPEPLAARAARDLVKLGTPGSLAALEALARTPGSAERAVAALAASPQGLTHLLVLRAADPSLQAIVDRSLAGHPPAVADLRVVVSAADDRASRMAVALLAGREDGVAALDACLRAQGPDARRCATGLTGPLAAKVLERALDSVDEQVRALAAWARASADEKPCLDALGPLAVDPSPSVRAAAALGLGRLGPAGVPLLRVLVHDRVDRVRSAAAGQLAEILPGGELAELVRRTVDDDAIRPELLPALARLPSDAAVTLLIEDLRRGNVAERRQAVAQLARFNDPRAYDALMEIASRDPDADARRMAARILGN